MNTHSLREVSMPLRLTGKQYTLYERVLRSRLGHMAAVQAAMVMLGELKDFTNAVPEGAVAMIRHHGAKLGVLEIFPHAPIMRPHP